MVTVDVEVVLLFLSHKQEKNNPNDECLMGEREEE
jgi:hypothetical protein